MKPALRAGSGVRMAVALILAVATVLGGCASASLPPARPIASIDAIAGAREGMADVNRRFVRWLVTITPDSRMTVEYADITLWGTVKVTDGSATYEITAATGRLTLYGDGQERMLEMADDRGSLYVQMKPR